METLTAKQKQYLEQPKERISGSEAIVRCLLAEGVEILYGYPGGAIMPVYDELYKYEGEINHVLTRHEQCAAHAAQGYARISGKVGVAMATSGPGATNSSYRNRRCTNRFNTHCMYYRASALPFIGK